MLRRLFNFLSVVSLLLCVATCGLWVRSYSTVDLIRYIGEESEAGSKSYFLSSTTGRIQLSCYVEADPPGPFAVAGGSRLPNEVSFSHWDSRAKRFRLPSDRLLNQIGFDARSKDQLLGTDYTVVVPYYAFVMAAFAVGAIAYLRRRLLVRSQTIGRCSACGYNLSASPERCPECGAAATNAVG